MKSEPVRHNARSKSTSILRIVLVIGVLCACLYIIREKVIAYECNYHFFPRQELAELYEELPNLRQTESNAFSVQDKWTYLNTTSIVGTTYQSPSSEYIIGFDMYEAVKMNETWSGLLDTGKIVTSEPPNQTQTQFFDICALKYHGFDWGNQRLSIQNNSQDIIWGYVRSVYVSPSGKIKSKMMPVQDNEITIDTKSGPYFLKEICMFSVYEQDAYKMQDEVLYQMKKNDLVIGAFTLRRLDIM